MAKEFNTTVGFIISIFDGLLAGGIGGCMGAITGSVIASILFGVCFGLVMIVLDFRYSFDEI